MSMKQGTGLAILVLVAAVLLPGGSPAWAAADLEEGVKDLADKITKGMIEKQKQKIAIVDFSDLNGNVTALGQFMAEELTTQLFLLAPGKFEVVERRQLLKLEEELILGQTGVLDEKGLKQIGKVLGVEAIVTGSMTDLGNTIKVNARMIAVESAKVFAVAATSIPKTGIVAELASKGTERRPGGGAQMAAASAATVSRPSSTEAVQQAEANNFQVALQGCKKGGDRTTCSLLITNLAEDRDLSLATGNMSKLYDSQGNVYDASSGSLGNSACASCWTYPLKLVSKIPTRAAISFEKTTAADGIALLEVSFNLIGRGVFPVQFRDVSLSK